MFDINIGFLTETLCRTFWKQLLQFLHDKTVLKMEFSAPWPYEWANHQCVRLRSKKFCQYWLSTWEIRHWLCLFQSYFGFLNRYGFIHPRFRSAKVDPTRFHPSIRTLGKNKRLVGFIGPLFIDSCIGLINSLSRVKRKFKQNANDLDAESKRIWRVNLNFKLIILQIDFPILQGWE